MAGIHTSKKKMTSTNSLCNSITNLVFYKLKYINEL